ncbi:MAG: TPM domain-containing protein [Chloroflexota bacterium]|nr:TPM domain-containing protein [Chloroflexota bacterium]
MRQLCVIVMSILVLMCGGIAAAQTTYPLQQDPYINDFADLLGTDREARLREMLVTLERDHGVTLVVVTIERMADYSTSSLTIESFATGLFNRWAIDDAESNDGILFLTSVGDRRVRIEVGAGYGTSLDDRVDDVIDEIITPAYRREDYAGGIEQGVIGIIRTVTVQAPTAVTSTAPESDSSSSILVPLLIGVLVVGGLIWFASRVMGSAHTPFNLPEGGGEPGGEMGDVRTPGFWGDGEGERINSGSYENDDEERDSRWSSRRRNSWSSGSSRRSSGGGRSSRRGGSSRGGGASGSW